MTGRRLLSAALAQLFLAAWPGLVATGARAQTPGDNAPLMLGIGCGLASGSVCAMVVPGLSARTARMGLAATSAPGTVAGLAAAVCHGRLAAAILPRAAIPPGCAADVVGPPLFPFYVMAVARAGTSFRHLDDLAEAHRAVAADPALLGLLASVPAWRNGLTIGAATNEDGPRRVAGGGADAYLALVSPDDPLLARNGGSSRFIDIHPPADLFRIGDGACLWRAAGLDLGSGTPITTISTDAVLLLGRDFRDAHARGGPRAADALADALVKAGTAILTATRSPPDWRPTAATCHDPADRPRN